MNSRRTLLGAMVTAVVALMALVAPAGALAAWAGITGDTGTWLPMGGPLTIRNMSPQLSLGFDPSEQRYSVSVVGPDGAPAADGVACGATASAAPAPVGYHGNGTYLVTVRTTTNRFDVGCVGLGPEQVFSFDIDAHSAVTVPAATVLTRRPGQSAFLSYTVRLELNPGAVLHQLRYGLDGSLPAGATDVVADARTGQATVTFGRPGTYVLVARARAGSGVTTTWSSPVRVRVVSPFDFVGMPSFADSRGPSYRITGAVREPTARGRITVSIGRGQRGRLRRLRSARIGRNGRFSLRFTLRRRGMYRLRYMFPGSDTVAPGYVQQGIRIKRARS